MNLEFVGFFIGIIGAMWMKISLSLFNQERSEPQVEGLSMERESPAMKAFIKGLSLILFGLGMETLARLFLN